MTPDKNKDFALCRRNILWFGSAGLLHKGLDIAVDFVLSHPEFTLHICGSSSGEKDFLDYYMPKIKNSKKPQKLSKTSRYFDFYDDIKAGCHKVVDW